MNTYNFRIRTHNVCKETIHNVENIFVIIFLTNISLFSNKGKYPIIKST